MNKEQYTTPKTDIEASIYTDHSFLDATNSPGDNLTPLTDKETAQAESLLNPPF